MDIEHACQKLIALGNGGMAQALEIQARSTAFTEMAFIERLSYLLVAEENHRDDRRLKRLLKAAKFKVHAIPEDIVFKPDRGLDRPVIAELLTCQWLRTHDNVLITGPTGSGKTWIACALGFAAVRAGKSVRYFRANPLLKEYAVAQVDGTAKRLLNQLSKIDVLILDDFAVAPVDERSKEHLLDILDARNGSTSTIVAGQRGLSEWHQYLDSPLLADAILDRLHQRSHKIKLQGDSMRSRQ